MTAPRARPRVQPATKSQDAFDDQSEDGDHDREEVPGLAIALKLNHLPESCRSARVDLVDIDRDGEGGSDRRKP
jgi:hypothetical protein